MNLQQCKDHACRQIDQYAEEIIALGEEILRTPELGYRETRTSARIRQKLSEAGVFEFTNPAITGVKGWLRGGKHVAHLALIGELDAVISPSHPFADPQTGAAHACGHNAQLAVLYGCARALSPLREFLGGDLCLLAAPAEECIELEFRKHLIEEGKLQYLGGKQQMIAEGVFEDIDLAMMVHSETGVSGPHVVVEGPASGFISKQVRFTGKEAHAGGAPWEGINALNAASLAIQAIHMQRETFRDEDRVRVHPILTKGGDLVNTVPADVRMESYVRAASAEAMKDANAKVNRAIRGAAYALGAQVEIEDLPGYLPLEQEHRMSVLFAQNAAALLGQNAVEYGKIFCGSTDMGDLGAVLPVIQPTISGFSGAAHSCDFRITDPALAYLVPAKLLAMTALDLLYGDAAEACRIRSHFPHKASADYSQIWSEILG